MSLRLGIVGKRGLAYLDAFRAIPETEVIALCETDLALRDHLATEHQIPLRFSEFEAMLDAVDAVVIATPMPLHVPQSVLALRAGKHVLSEVTAAVSLDECWELLDAAQDSSGIYMMAENYCYFRENVLVRQMVREGLFGELYFGEGEYLHEVRDLYHTTEGQPTWRHTWMGNINGNIYPSHSLGPVMQWFHAADPQERIERVVCVGSGRHTAPEYIAEDTSLLLCTLNSGKLIKIRLDLMSNRPHQMGYYALQGTNGVYESSRIAGEPGHLWLGENKTGTHREWKSTQEFETHLPETWRHPPEAALHAGHGGGDFWVALDFVQAVTAGLPPAIDIFDALEWTAAGLCSQISIQNGGLPVHVPNFRDPVERHRSLLLNFPS